MGIPWDGMGWVGIICCGMGWDGMGQKNMSHGQAWVLTYSKDYSVHCADSSLFFSFFGKRQNICLNLRMRGLDYYVSYYNKTRVIVSTVL